MANLKYRLVVNNNDKQNTYGMFYARAVIEETIGIDEIAQKIEANVSVKRSDVLAVLSELGVVITDLLANSKRVKLPYLGAFKLGISSAAAADKESFNVREHIKGIHVIFQPEGSYDNKGRLHRTMTDNVSLALATDGTPKKKSSSGSTTGDDDGVERP